MFGARFFKIRHEGIRRGITLAAVSFFACLCVAAASLEGWLRPFDSALLETQYRLFPSRASGSLVLVAIDPRSIQAISSWPWPRRLHAELTERLIAAGARNVAFDIDFSSSSNPADDEALARSFHEASGRIVLPIFEQTQLTAGVEQPDLVYTAPLEPFQRDAQLGIVTMRPDRDGRIWRVRRWGAWKGWNIRNLAAALADAAQSETQLSIARQDRSAPREFGSFLIDYGIAPETLPRLSYVDVLRGNFDPAAVAGKTILIGATAVELGDYHAVPIHAALPGAVIQSLTYETIVQHRMTREIGKIWVLLGSLLLAIPMGVVLHRLSWRRGAIVTATGAGLLIVGAMLLGERAHLHVGAAAPAASLALVYLFTVLRRLDLQALRIFDDQIAATQRRALMKCVVDSSSDGIVIAEASGAVTLINPAAAAMIGCAKDAVGATIGQLLPCGPDALAADPLRIGAAARFDAVLMPADKPPIEVEITLASAALEPQRHTIDRREPARPVFIYTLHDITERKRAEEAQRTATTEAIAHSKAKTEFLANMSHELRTPLNAVIGFAEVIRDQMLGPIERTEYREYADDIRKAGLHLLDLINDILSVSRIELGKIRLNEAELDIDRTVRTALRLLGLRAEEKSISIAIDLPQNLPALSADERALKQILVNILANAVKFSASQSRISITARDDGPHGLTIAVADQGIGISAEMLAKVKQPFFQVDAALERRFEGAGLGLAIADGLMTLHGGTLDIESSVGPGTTVTLCFPAARLCRALAA